MNMQLHKIYRPITATPFKAAGDYMEFEPCDALKPYIRCFWGTPRPVEQQEKAADTTGIVTPDTCMDIIFTVDFTNNKIDNCFCGIDDRIFTTCQHNEAHRTVFLFAIRFYPWGASVFAEDSMKDTKNAFFDTGHHFAGLKKAIEPELFEVKHMEQFIPKAESALLKYYNEKHKNPLVLQAVHHMLARKGNIQVSELRKALFVSERQLERLFREYVGVTPKSLAAMVRYQYLWNDIAYSRQFNILDAVCQYGYADQAHLCHDFKKYHAMNIAEAKKYALENVGNVQDTSVILT